MLLMNRSHHIEDAASSDTVINNKTENMHLSGTSNIGGFRRSNFLTTSLKLRLFGRGVKEMKPTDKVVYLSGCWDMFHDGHIELLREAKSMGDYVVAGVHNDYLVNVQRGKTKE